jgi:hypothetical protein
MKLAIPVSPLNVSLVLLVALLVGFGSFHALSALATPARFKTELDTVQASIDYAERAQTEQSGGRYPAGAVCRRALVAATADLRARLDASIRQAGLSIGQVSVVADSSSAVTGLTTLRVALEAEGAPEGATRLTAALDDMRPLVFIDHYELRRQATGASLKIAGRAFCWSEASK